MLRFRVIESNPPKGGRKVKATPRQRAYRAFFARRRKAGKTAKQIAREWRAKGSGSRRAPARSSSKRRAPARSSSKRRAPRGRSRAVARTRRAQKARRNPDGIGDRLQAGLSEAFSLETGKTGLAVLSGAVIATGAPSLVGKWNQGWLGLGLSAAAAAAAGVVAAAVSPAYVVPVAAGGVVVVGLRLLAQFLPRVLRWSRPPAGVAGYLPAPARPQVAGYLPASVSTPRIAGYLPARTGTPRIAGYQSQGNRGERFKARRF